jgi:hypothetical protein
MDGVIDHHAVDPLFFVDCSAKTCCCLVWLHGLLEAWQDHPIGLYGDSKSTGLHICYKIVTYVDTDFVVLSAYLVVVEQGSIDGICGSKICVGMSMFGYDNFLVETDYIIISLFLQRIISVLFTSFLDE